MVAANNIDLSLTDIIKKNRKTKKGQAVRGKGRGGNRGRGNRAANRGGRGANNNNNKAQANKNQSILRKTRGGGVGQRRGRGILSSFYPNTYN